VVGSTNIIVARLILLLL